MNQRLTQRVAVLLLIAAAAVQVRAEEQRLPRLVDLGAGACSSCKKMAPILEEMKTEYAGILIVEFIDVWKNATAGKEYGIKSIPTQIFFGADGKELFRHEGFLSKEDMLAKWNELGYELKVTTKAKQAESKEGTDTGQQNRGGR